MVQMYIRITDISCDRYIIVCIKNALKPRLYAQYAHRCKYTPGGRFAPGVHFGHVNGAL